MKQKVLALFACVVIPAIATACCCGDGSNTLAARIGTYERAEVIQPRSYQYWITDPVGGLKIDNGGYDLGFLARPSVGAGTGISPRFDISVQTDLNDGFWAFGKYGLVTGPNAMSIGAKVSASGFPLPGDSPNPLDTTNRNSRGHYDLSASYLIDSKPGAFQWTLGLGPSFNYDKNRYGRGSSLHIGAEFEAFSKELWEKGPIVAPYVAIDARAVRFDPSTNSFVAPPVQAAVGLTLSGIAGVDSRQ